MQGLIEGDRNSTRENLYFHGNEEMFSVCLFFLWHVCDQNTWVLEQNKDRAAKKNNLIPGIAQQRYQLISW